MQPVAPAGEQGATVEADVPEVAKLDIRIGKVVQIETHPDADRRAALHTPLVPKLPSSHLRGNCSGVVLLMPTSHQNRLVCYVAAAVANVDLSKGFLKDIQLVYLYTVTG